MSPANPTVRLRELLEAPTLATLEVLHLSPRTLVVRDVLLVSDIEDVSGVGPDTVVVLSDAVALGGWMVSAALRYAWERRAVAVVVPERSHTATVVDLARRLDVTLLSSTRDITRVALDIATAIGSLRAAAQTRVALLLDRLPGAASLDDVAAVISQTLSGSAVHIVVAGAVAARRGEEGAGTPVRVEVPGDADEVPVRIQAVVPAADAEAVLPVLRAAGPSVRAVLLRDDLRSGLAAAGTLPSVAAAASATDTGASVPDRLVAVVLLSASGRPETLLGSPLAQAWRRAHPRVALERDADGWVGLIPARAELPRVFRAADERMLGALGVRGGVSRILPGRDAAAAIAQARLAARLADAAGRTLLPYVQIRVPLLRRLLPSELVRDLAAGILPELAADPQADALMAAAEAYLDCAGSVSRAAGRLGMHRNTMLARLRRLAELGVDVADPDAALIIHLVAASWRGAATAEGAPE